jgi:hypothetical protein
MPPGGLGLVGPDYRLEVAFGAVTQRSLTGRKHTVLEPFGPSKNATSA